MRRVVRDDLVDALLSIPPTVQPLAGSAGNRVNGLRWSAAERRQERLINNYDRAVFGTLIANHYTVATGAVTTFAVAVGS